MDKVHLQMNKTVCGMTARKLLYPLPYLTNRKRTAYRFMGTAAQTLFTGA